jgi:hypothetical protein
LSSDQCQKEYADCKHEQGSLRARIDLEALEKQICYLRDQYKQCFCHFLFLWKDKASDYHIKTKTLQESLQEGLPANPWIF